MPNQNPSSVFGFCKAELKPKDRGEGHTEKNSESGKACCQLK